MTWDKKLLWDFFKFFYEEFKEQLKDLNWFSIIIIIPIIVVIVNTIYKIISKKNTKLVVDKNRGISALDFLTNVLDGKKLFLVAHRKDIIQQQKTNSREDVIDALINLLNIGVSKGLYVVFVVEFHRDQYPEWESFWNWAELRTYIQAIMLRLKKSRPITVFLKSPVNALSRQQVVDSLMNKIYFVVCGLQSSSENNELCVEFSYKQLYEINPCVDYTSKKNYAEYLLSCQVPHNWTKIIQHTTNCYRDDKKYFGLYLTVSGNNTVDSWGWIPNYDMDKEDPLERDYVIELPLPHNYYSKVNEAVQKILDGINVNPETQTGIKVLQELRNEDMAILNIEQFLMYPEFKLIGNDDNIS